MNNELRDPLEKVSNSLRRAVSVNKSKETDLRSRVSTIQRERRRIENSWSVKQEKFLRAKLKLMPAMRREKRENEAARIRRLLLERLSPLAAVKDANQNSSGVEQSLQTSIETQKGTRANALPPLNTSLKQRKVSEARHQFYVPPSANEDYKISDDVKDVLQTRARRISEHKGPKKSILHTDEKQLGTLTVRHRLSKVEFRNPNIEQSSEFMAEIKEEENDSSEKDKHNLGLKKKDSRPSVVSKDHVSNLDNGRDNDQVHSRRGDNSLPSIHSILPKDNEQGNKLAQSGWRKVRESLKAITGREKRKDIAHMSMLELTKLFEDIRECRYLRVGNHTSYRGDSVNTKQCKCIACTVVDKTKLRNNLSAPE